MTDTRQLNGIRATPSPALSVAKESGRVACVPWPEPEAYGQSDD